MAHDLIDAVISALCAIFGAFAAVGLGRSSSLYHNNIVIS